MALWRSLAAGVCSVALAGPLAAQSYPLAETPREGDCARVTLSMTLAGELRVSRDGKTTPLKLAAAAAHEFDEKALAVTDKGVKKAARHYAKAESAVTVGTDRVDRALAADHRLVVAQKAADATLSYSPAGPLTREEAEVAAHFDTLAVPGLLPGKEVQTSESWDVPKPVVQALCQFEGLISHDLKGKLVSVTDGVAVFEVTGKATGIDRGALAKVTVTATGRFELLTRRVARLEWKQVDERDQGPVSPASSVESAVVVERKALEAEPKELAKTALVSVPDGDDPPAVLKQIAYRDPKGRYELAHSRDWHSVGVTDDHYVLRLMDRGDLVAQATLTPWQKAEKGKHLSAAEFKQAMAATPGWEAEEVVEDGEIPTAPGHWVYRFSARGTLDGVKVAQSFCLVAGPEGDQLVVVFTLKPANLSTIGTRDLALVNAVAFPRK